MPGPLSFRDLATITWYERAIVCRLHRPARVLSTARVRGGVQEPVEAIINHQIGAPGQCPTDRVPETQLDEHLDRLAQRLGCDPHRTVAMITAARMENAGWADRAFADLVVRSLVTAGVSENAACAGDPAGYYQTPDGWRRAVDGLPPGTINVLVLVDRPVTPGGLVKAGIMLTEAKSATLQALGVRSRYSAAIATGTGTDQYAVVCPTQGAFALSEAQAHTKLGELIAQSVGEALRMALQRQNSLGPETQRSVRRLLARFGTEVDWPDRDGDAQAVAAAVGLAAVLDHLRWGILPAADRPAVAARHAAILAAALAGDPAVAAGVEATLHQRLASCPNLSEAAVIDQAVACARAAVGRVQAG